MLVKTPLLLLLLLSFDTLYAQKKINFYGGVHLTTDAELYMTGPSFQAGASYYVTSRLSVSSYLHYFAVRRKETLAFAGQSKFFFNTVTAAALFQIDGGRNPDHGMYYGLGLAFQNLIREYRYSASEEFNENRNNIVPAARIGYLFKVKRSHLGVEINCTGPAGNNVNDVYYFDILTQLSLGLRFVF